MGLSYTDVSTTNLISTYTYNIYKTKSRVLIGSVIISPDGVIPSIPIPTLLKEAGVYDAPTGPGEVGVIGTTSRSHQPRAL